jgi:superfamily I DNA and RNA helicase
MHGDHQSFGELDAVVVAPSGHVMLLEVKAGSVSVSGNALVKTYSNAGGTKIKDIGHQSRRQHGAMLDRLSEEGLSAVYLGHLLVLADHTVESGTVAYPRERIVDASQLSSLCAHIKTALQKEVLPQTTRTRVMDFWANRFDVHPDASTQMGQVQKVNISLAEGLATWVPRISHSGGVYMVDATAGSGKSQLALALLREAVSKHLRAAYVCYNRPLADHMVQVVPHAVEVSTFHEYCAAFSRKQGVEPDFSTSVVFKDIESRLLEHADTQVALLDLLVVDESQDFDPQWVQALLQRLKSDGRLYVMGDANQQVYARDPFDLSEAVHIRCMDNFRSPRKVVQVMNQLGLTPEPIQPRSVYLGSVPGFHTYVPGATGKTGSMAMLERCLHTLFDDGVRAEQIAVITFAGRDRSDVLSKDKLAGLSLKHFTGKYDVASNPVWTSGELLVETLYRFKGQSAPVVVLCEVDFEELTEKERRKLFVGFTRAQFRLECILSERVEQLLFEQV